MGGAIAAHACARGLVPNLSGLIVIDVVEGTAMDALAGMMRFLRSRPVTFESEEVGGCLYRGTCVLLHVYMCDL